jgi:hypothetical protein
VIGMPRSLVSGILVRERRGGDRLIGMIAWFTT